MFWTFYSWCLLVCLSVCVGGKPVSYWTLFVCGYLCDIVSFVWVFLSATVPTNNLLPGIWQLDKHLACCYIQLMSFISIFRTLVIKVTRRMMTKTWKYCIMMQYFWLYKLSLPLGLFLAWWRSWMLWCQYCCVLCHVRPTNIVFTFSGIVCCQCGSLISVFYWQWRLLFSCLLGLGQCNKQSPSVDDWV